MVTVENISKSYGSVQALKDISFRFEKGEIFGLIGPDGAGKTTLFRILTTLILPDTGSASIDGFDMVRDYRQIRDCVGYMPGRFSLYPDLTVDENLSFFATVFKTTVEENYHLVKDIYDHIKPFGDRRAGALSGGMKQKLALCCALIHKPSVLFLDEPTTGIDPESRKELWDMLKNLKNQGISILVSTPYMDEAGLCDRIALIKDGAFLDINPPEKILATFKEPLWAVSSGKMSKLLYDLRSHGEVTSSFAFGDTHHITAAQTLSQDRLKIYLAEKGHPDAVIQSIDAGIEDCFMALSKRETKP